MTKNYVNIDYQNDKNMTKVKCVYSITSCYRFQSECIESPVSYMP